MKQIFYHIMNNKRVLSNKTHKVDILPVSTVLGPLSQMESHILICNIGIFRGNHYCENNTYTMTVDHKILESIPRLYDSSTQEYLTSQVNIKIGSKTNISREAQSDSIENPSQKC